MYPTRKLFRHSVSMFKGKPWRAFLAMLLTFSIFAQDAGTDEELDDLSLGDLFDLDVEVTVASKKAEKISDAPGVIVAYTDKDMENLGYFTIRDLANITPGYSSFRSIGEITLETRGQKTGGFDNNKHLLLVDGIPVRHVRAGKVPVEEEISLYGMKRVEFMKGPGSALYGTGAFSGVISVVPQTLKENGVKAGAKISYGSDNNTKNAAGYVSAKNDAGEFRLSASYFDKETQGEACQVRNRVDGVDNTEFISGFDDWNDRNAVFINANYTHNSGFGLGAIYSKKTGGMGEFWWSESSIFNDITWEIAIPYVRFNRSLNDKLSLNSYLLFNQSTEKTFQDPGYTEVSVNWWETVTDTLGNTDTILHTADGDWAGTYERKMRDMEILAEVGIDLNKAGNIIAGFNYDVRKDLATNDASSGSWDQWSGPGIGGWPSKGLSTYEDSERFHTISFYAQYQVEAPLLSGLRATVGFREDIGKTETNSFSQFSPRVGLVQKFTDFLNLKLLYGTALRAPGIKEVSVNTEAKNKGVKGVPDVGAETVTSLETSLNLSLDKVAASVAGYYTIFGDALARTKQIGTETVYENADDDSKAMGIEATAIAMPVKYLKIMAGVSFAKATNEIEHKNETTGKVDSTTTIQMNNVPVSKLNLATTVYTHTKILPLRITPILTFIPKYRLGGDPEKDNNYIDENNGKFLNIDVNMGVDIVKNLGLEVQINNIVNSKAYQPGEFFGPGQLDLKVPGRSVKVSLTSKF